MAQYSREFRSAVSTDQDRGDRNPRNQNQMGRQGGGDQQNRGQDQNKPTATFYGITGGYGPPGGVGGGGDNNMGTMDDPLGAATYGTTTTRYNTGATAGHTGSGVGGMGGYGGVGGVGGYGGDAAGGHRGDGYGTTGGAGYGTRGGDVGGGGLGGNVGSGGDSRENRGNAGGRK